MKPERTKEEILQHHCPWLTELEIKRVTEAMEEYRQSSPVESKWDEFDKWMDVCVMTNSIEMYGVTAVINKLQSHFKITRLTIPELPIEETKEK